MNKLSYILKPTILMCASWFNFSNVSYANDFSTDGLYLQFKNNLTSATISNEEVDALMLGTKFLPDVLRIMSKPGESKEWYEYKLNFMSQGTISGGKAFSRKYKQILESAEKKYGVDQQAILGILGVETAYGRNMGNFLVKDALATLAFRGDRRNDYFANELKALIQLHLAGKVNLFTLKGSYAGAFGYGQFMPSSLQKYGIDFDGNGEINLNNAVDAIGSVANYLKQHGWQYKKAVMYEARYVGSNDQQVICKSIDEPTTAMSLYKLGLQPLYDQLQVNDSVCGIRLIDTQGAIYYFTFNNFRTITLYNRSRLYATAVWKLGNAVVD